MNRRGGFSLIELLVMLVVLGTIAGLAAPSTVAFLNKYKLDGAARLVWSDMNAAKMTAIKMNQTINVQILNATTYRYTYTDALAVSHECYRDFSADYPGVSISIDSGTTVTFRSNGMGLPGTTRTVTVTNGTGSRSFTVSWTGRIESL